MTHEQHQNVSSLVSDLVQMAEATRRLPEVERELAEMRSASSRDGDTIARLERKLMDRSAEIDELKSKLRSVEAERDDAGFRQLEAEDKVAALTNAIEGVFPALGEALGTVDGSSRVRVMRMTEIDRQGYLNWQAEKMERLLHEEQEAARKAAEEARLATIRPIEPSYPPLQAEAQPTGSESFKQEGGESAADPTVQSASTGLGIASSDTVVTTVNVLQELPASGQSDPLPTAPTQPIPEPVISTTATSQDGATSSEPHVGRYTGKRYWDHPYYVPEESWVANGGTLEDYHWKPAANA